MTDKPEEEKEVANFACDWLERQRETRIRRALRYRRRYKENKRMKIHVMKQRHELKAELTHLREQVRVMREALEFYANKEHWEGVLRPEEDDSWMDTDIERTGYFPPKPSEEFVAFVEDEGKRARQALQDKGGG